MSSVGLFILLLIPLLFEVIRNFILIVFTGFLEGSLLWNYDIADIVQSISCCMWWKRIKNSLKCILSCAYVWGEYCHKRKLTEFYLSLNWIYRRETYFSCFDCPYTKVFTRHWLFFSPPCSRVTWCFSVEGEIRQIFRVFHVIFQESCHHVLTLRLFGDIFWDLFWSC